MISEWTQRLSKATDLPPKQLRDLYAEATSSISVDRFKGDPRLLDIWLEYLRLDASVATPSTYTEIRDKYKYLKSRVSSSALLYVHWSRFEAHTCGDVLKALAILQAAIKAKAQPLNILNTEISSLMEEFPDVAKGGNAISMATKAITPRPSENSLPNKTLCTEPIRRVIGPSPTSPSKNESTKEERSKQSITHAPFTVLDQNKPPGYSSAAEKMKALLAGYKNGSITTASVQNIQSATPIQETKDLGDELPARVNNEEPTKTLVSPPNATAGVPIDTTKTMVSSTTIASDSFASTPRHTDPATRDLSLLKGTIKEALPGSAFETPVSFQKGTSIGPARLPSMREGTDYMMPTAPPSVSSASGESSLLINLNGRRYKRISLIGRGASSKVYKVVSLDTSDIFALKKVRLRIGEEEQHVGYKNEISLLQKLRGSDAIIGLKDWEVCNDGRSLLLLLEYGEIDLAHLLQKDTSLIGNLKFVRLQWKQMLQAVQQIHSLKIVHSDLKPANFLFVSNRLKLIDFGIAKSIPNDTTNVAREYQTGTLNYMAPEAILFTETTGSAAGTAAKLKLGRPSDIWSLGCILYQLLYGAPPFAALPIVQKLNAIVDPNFQISFPSKMGIEGRAGEVDAAAVEVLRSCLNRDPKKRMTIPQLLEHEFLDDYDEPSGKRKKCSEVVSISRQDLLSLLQRGNTATCKTPKEWEALADKCFDELSKPPPK